MQIKPITGINMAKNLSKSVSKPLETIPNIFQKHGASDIMPVAASLSGAYIMEKAVKSEKERKKAVKELNLTPEISKKILNVENNKGKKVFDLKGIKLLKEVSEVKDYAMFSFIIKNIDYINSIEKIKEPSFETEIVTYKTHAQTPEGEKKASITVTNNGAVTVFKGTDYNADGTPINIERVCDDTIISDRKNVYFGDKENVTYDKFKQTLTTEKLDGAGQIKYSRVTSLSKDNLIQDSFERFFETENSTKSSTKVKDYKNNITMKVDEEQTGLQNKYYAKYNALKEIRTYINPVTGKKETLKMELSEVPGIYNTIITDEFGRQRVESMGKIDSEGYYVVEKHLQSIDGTMTNYNYRASKDELDVVMHYDIKSADGKPLTTVDRTFKRVSPELAYSSINGHNYVIRNNEDAIEIEDKFNNTKTTITYDEFFTYTDDLNRRELINKMSGDMLIDMHNRKYSYTYAENIYKSGISPKEGEIEAQDDIFTFSHEQGHSKDVIRPYDNDYNKEIAKDKLFQNRIASNPNFLKTFKSERNQFRAHSPKLEQEYISYFTNSLLRGSEETIAETNALFSTGLPNSKGNFTRVYYLQKYFPKTIAVLSNLLNPNSNIYVGK